MFTGELTGVVGEAVTVQVRVDDDNGDPLGQYPVQLAPGPGSGSAAPPRLSTDGAGVASFQCMRGL